MELYPTRLSGIGPLPSFPIHLEEGYGPAMAHIAKWDPARVVAECEAKRALVQFLDLDDDAGEGRYVAERVLALLALPYADHPEFRQEWKT